MKKQLKSKSIPIMKIEGEFDVNEKRNKNSNFAYNFKTDPIKLIEGKNPQKEIYENKYNYYTQKNPQKEIYDNKYNYYTQPSDKTCSFSLKNEINDNYSESYLALVVADDQNFPADDKNFLVVLNPSTRKREILLQKDNKSKVNFISCFPKEEYADDFQNGRKKWLYCGDKSGKINIYENSSSKAASFQLKSEISITADKKEKTMEILSALIFQDKFYEINNSTYSPCCYIMISACSEVSFYPKEPEIKKLFLYKNSEITKEWELVREIKNPTNQKCKTVNFYYYEVLKKTLFFFGFSKSYVALYDLKIDKFQESKCKFATTDGDVSWINFIFKRKKTNDAVNLQSFENYDYLAYINTKKNTYSYEADNILIGNITTGEIVKQIKLDENICDCCVWNNTIDKTTYLIVATKLSIQIIDFNSMKVSFVLKIENTLNLAKVLCQPSEKSKKENGEESGYSECLSILREQQRKIIGLFDPNKRYLEGIF